MMSTSAAANLLRRQALSAVSRIVPRQSAVPSCVTNNNLNVSLWKSARCFSAAVEEQLVPGIGMGKTSTGLVGVPVDLEATSKMITKYQALLEKLAASDMPPSAQYRINIEKIARFRIAAAQENLDDPEKVEELCNCGQVEELVIQADNEMIVMDMYLRNRWWELVKPLEVEFNPDHAEDHGDVEWGEAPKEGEKK